MRVQVRKCPFTGKLFEEKDINKYIKHLKDLRGKNRHIRRENKIRDTFWIWLKKEKKSITHPDMIPGWFMKNQQMLMDAHNAGCRAKHQHSWHDDKFFETDNFVDVNFSKTPDFRDLLSNSHSCPDNGRTNFSRENGIPIGYPGWKTSIGGKLVRSKKHDSSYPYGNALNLVGIKTGSGGGGNSSWNYDCSIFLADWPGLQVEYANILQQRHDAEGVEIIRRLKGRR